MLRRIDAPGIQINEIDKSQYGMADYSIVGTTCFICGFADKGQDYAIKWINTIQTLIDNYGYPQTEEERYFWNACAEVLNKGGVCLAAKLPYANKAVETLPYVDYSISYVKELDASSKYSMLSTVDPSLTSYIELKQEVDSNYSGYIDIDRYDRMCVSETNAPDDTMRIVCIDNQKYGTFDVAKSERKNSNTVTTYETTECLGIMPIVVAPAEAMFYQRILSSKTEATELCDTTVIATYPYVEKFNLSTNEVQLGGSTYLDYAIVEGANNVKYVVSVDNLDPSITKNIPLTAFPKTSADVNAPSALLDEDNAPIPFKKSVAYISNGELSTEEVAYVSSYISAAPNGLFEERTDYISTFTPIKDIDTVKSADDGKTTANGMNLQQSNFSLPLSGTSLNDYTVSKAAIECFPNISLEQYNRVDSDTLKLIGIAVFKVDKDPANNQRIICSLQESYVGSLDKSTKNTQGQSLFIDNVVNNDSKLIRVFSNMSRLKMPWKKDDQSLQMQYLTAHERTCFYGCSNQIGVILGQYEKRCSKTIRYQDSIIKPLNLIFEAAKDRNKWNIDLVVDAGLANIAQSRYGKEDTATSYNYDVEKLKLMQLKSQTDSSNWITVLNKFDTFCKNMRKDCMFLADGLRPFCLDGDQKIVRDTAPENSIDLDIVPKLKHMAGLNTSYGAGYCDWFKCRDAASGDLMWMPPSIKAMGIYLYTDAYWNTWDAPAGMNRGVVGDAIDVAFSPNQDEAGKLYVQSWNYACNYPIDGIVLEGQKTFQRRKTAFDRVNVRRLFLYLEKQVERIARYFVYEGNNQYNRERFVDTIRPLFEDAKQRNGILEYVIKCDDDNNTPQTIDNNELRCSIAIKPVKTIEFILLNFICTNQSAVVTEQII